MMIATANILRTVRVLKVVAEALASVAVVEVLSTGEEVDDEAESVMEVVVDSAASLADVKAPAVGEEVREGMDSVCLDDGEVAMLVAWLTGVDDVAADDD